MKILNLYSSIWWNRKLRGDDHDITAVEMEQARADYYQERFPNDTVIVWDAHEYLLRNYKEFDFIRASPPCPTHSRLVFSNETRFYKAWTMVYPDMKLYQEIILLKTRVPSNVKRVIENVIPYYDLLIPWQTIERHIFWCNFYIPPFIWKQWRKIRSIDWVQIVEWFDIKDTKIKNKRKALRDMVNPELALHILEASQIERQQNLFFER